MAIDQVNARLLAEVLRLQRWAGGENVSASRIYGLMHGVESVMNEEFDSHGISEETQRKVEDILEDVECGQQSTEGMHIKQRLIRDRISDADANTIMEAGWPC